MSNKITPRRGHIYRISFEPGTPVMYGLIISIDAHNTLSSEYITAQVTTSKADQVGLPGSVRLSSGDPAFGYVVCRDIGMIHHDEMLEDLGPLSLDTQIKVNQALKRTLGL